MAKKSVKKLDECWFCGKDIVKNQLYVDTVVMRNCKEKGVVHRTCVECAMAELKVAAESIVAALESKE